jgi:hypothetical protein
MNVTTATGQEKPMSETAIAVENGEKSAADAKPKRARKAASKGKPGKKMARAKMPADKPSADRTNKKAEVIALMKRARGVRI